MRISIIALGSRGDVQPYVAIGKGLRAAGHSVRAVTHAPPKASYAAAVSTSPPSALIPGFWWCR